MKNIKTYILVGFCLLLAAVNIGFSTEKIIPDNIDNLLAIHSAYADRAYSGSIRTPILKTSGQAFRNYSDTHSGNIRTVVPETSGH